MDINEEINDIRRRAGLTEGWFSNKPNFDKDLGELKRLLFYVSDKPDLEELVNETITELMNFFLSEHSMDELVQMSSDLVDVLDDRIKHSSKAAKGDLRMERANEMNQIAPKVIRWFFSSMGSDDMNGASLNALSKDWIDKAMG